MGEPAIDERDALLVVDVQYDFLPVGALAVPRGDEVVEPITGLVPRFETVILTQDFHPPGHVSFASTHGGKQPYQAIDLPGGPQALWPDHCVAGTRGADVHQQLRTPTLDRHVSLVLRKGTRRDVDSYSAFRENTDARGRRASTGLGEWLMARGIERVFVVGLARDFCVAWSALDAKAQSFRTVVIDSCTRPVFPDRTAETDAELERAGVSVIASL
jgi:nicotinamidase/pyrazinamidase